MAVCEVARPLRHPVERAQVGSDRRIRRASSSVSGLSASGCPVSRSAYRTRMSGGASVFARGVEILGRSAGVIPPVAWNRGSSSRGMSGRGGRPRTGRRAFAPETPRRRRQFQHPPRGFRTKHEGMTEPERG